MPVLAVCPETRGEKTWLTRRLCLLIFQSGWCHPEFSGKRDRSQRAQKFHDCVMVNGVTDTKHQLSRNGRAGTLSIAIAITNTVSDCAIMVQYIRRNCLQCLQDFLCCKARDFDEGFDVPVAAPIVVVDLVVPQTFDQAKEMIQDVSVVRANRRPPWSFFLPRIGVLVNAVKQGETLAQHIFRSRDER